MNGPVVTVAHALRGRVRLSVPALRDHREAGHRVASALVKLEDLDRVTVRSATGSIIVERSRSPIDAHKIARRVDELLRDEHDGEAHSAIEGAGDGIGRTRLGRAMVAAAAGVNEDVRRSLGGEADLGSLIPLALLASSAAQVVRSGRWAPVPWYVLTWYGLQSFTTWNARPKDG